MPTYFENVIGEGANQVVGDPLVMGLMFLGFFMAFIMLQNTRLDHKIMVLVPASILAMVWIPWFSIVLALVGGGMMYLVVMKFTNK